MLLLYRVDVNNDPKADSDQLTALQSAIRGRKTELVKTLLNAGCNVNASIRRWREQTALQSAIDFIKGSGLRLGVVQILLVAGADVNAPQKGRMCASILESAIFTGDEELVQILLKEGADVNRGSGLEGPIILTLTSNLAW